MYIAYDSSVFQNIHPPDASDCYLTDSFFFLTTTRADPVLGLRAYVTNAAGYRGGFLAPGVKAKAGFKRICYL